MRKSTLSITSKSGYIQILALLLFTITPLANIKTLAQTPSTQTQCTEVEIKNHIQKLSSSQPSIYDALVACKSQAVPELIQALGNQNKQVRIMTITALGEIASPSAVPSLSNLLSTETRWDVRVAIVSALSKFRKQGVPTLINALTDKDWYIRYQAANALGEIGPEAKDAVPALNDAVKDKNENVRLAATSTLEEINKYPTFDVSSKNSTSKGTGDSIRTKPPLMCQVPALRIIFKWKCSR